MEKVLAIMLVMSLMTVSCNKSGGGSSSSGTTASTSQSSTGDNSSTDNSSTDNNNTDNSNPTPVDPVDPTPPVSSTVPALALSFKTNVSYLSGFDQSATDKYNAAVALVKKVVATEEFRNQVLNFTYNGTKAFVQNNGLTNEEIYQDILEAAETLQPAKNNTMDVGVKLYYENSSTVGYTSGSITYINVNTKFFNSYQPNSVAGNLFHEWLHKLGYSHDSAATARRPYSVPYAIGYIVGNIGKKFL